MEVHSQYSGPDVCAIACPSLLKAFYSCPEQLVRLELLFLELLVLEGSSGRKMGQGV